MGVTFCIPTSSEWEFLLIHILTSIWCCQCSDFGHSSRCVVISLFNLHFPDDIQCGTSFYMLFVLCISYLVRCLVRSLAHFNQFVFLLLNFKSSSYILVIVLYLIYIFAHIFSQSVACLFILLTMSFTKQKTLILTKPNLSIISFIDHSFGIESQISLPYPRSSRYFKLFLWRVESLCLG